MKIKCLESIVYRHSLNHLASMNMRSNILIFVLLLVPFLALAKNDVDSITIANDALPSSTVNSLPDHGLHPVEKKTGNLIITLKLLFKMSLNTHKNKKFY